MFARFALLTLAALLFAPAAAQAKRQSLPSGKVAHSRAAPVIAHRLVPPFAGVHVYEPARGR